MVLSDSEIRELLRKKELIIHPILEDDQIHCAKVDLRLDNVLYLTRRFEKPSFDTWLDDPAKYGETKVIPYDGKFSLQRGEFAVAPTLERMKMPNNLMGRLEGRSSLGRLGIIVHATAGGIDPTWSGQVICELSNVGSVTVELHPLMRIVSVIFDRIDGKVEMTYEKRKKDGSAKYDTQLESRIRADKEIDKLRRMWELPIHH